MLGEHLVRAMERIGLGDIRRDASDLAPRGLSTKELAAPFQKAAMIITYAKCSGHRQPKQCCRVRRVVHCFRLCVDSDRYAARALSRLTREATL